MASEILVTSAGLCIIIFFSLTIIVHGQGKIQQTNENLGFQYGLLQQGLALIVIVGGAGAAAFFAWQRERRIPPAAEQEKIFGDLVKDWYSSSYLLVFHKIWDKIQESNIVDEQLVNDYWEILCHKRFDTEKFKKNIP